ncbi:hypothetical protein H8959_014053 [Pygathrix nigripes]
MRDVPKLKVCALHVSSWACSQIAKAGDKILTFNQLALDTLKGCGTILLSGPYKGQEVYWNFVILPERNEEQNLQELSHNADKYHMGDYCKEEIDDSIFY